MAGRGQILIVGDWLHRSVLAVDLQSGMRHNIGSRLSFLKLGRERRRAARGRPVPARSKARVLHDR